MERVDRHNFTYFNNFLLLTKIFLSFHDSARTSFVGPANLRNCFLGRLELPQRDGPLEELPASISALREIQMKIPKIPNKNTQNGDWKHYTSNCEKIVKCGRVSATRSFHSIVSHSTTRPTISDGRQKFYFVALLLSISHFQGATLDIHKFGCRDVFMNEFFVAFDRRVDIEPSDTANMHIMMFSLSFLMTKKERERERAWNKSVAGLKWTLIASTSKNSIEFSFLEFRLYRITATTTPM